MIDFGPNFDETEKEPLVLPVRIPNLLVNGAEGIAVGMATNIPPHNLAEVIDGTVALIDNPEITVDALMEYIPAPDFPTGGILMGRSGIRKAYRTGPGTTIIPPTCATAAPAPGAPRPALACILLTLFPTSIGQPIVLYVAALGNVDNSIIEAAQVDGATKLQVFWKIKWPAIMPTTLYVLVITTINSFQGFALIQLMTKGGPMNATMTIMYQVYDSAYRLYDLGYANAIGVVLAIIIAIFSAIQFKVAKTDN